jgi:hypothetical protein
LQKQTSIRCAEAFARWEEQKPKPQSGGGSALQKTANRRNPHFVDLYLKTQTAKWIRDYMIETYGEKCMFCDWSEINPYTGKVPIELSHKDGNFMNNCRENIKWATSTEIAKSLHYCKYWKTIKQYPKYLISQDGEVYSKERQILMTKSTNKGYYYVQLFNNGKSKNYFVHQLVCHAYVEGYKDGNVTNHKNRNKSDNRADNLEWVTQKDNTRHAYITGFNNKDGSALTYNEKGIVQILNGQIINTFTFIVDAEKETGIKAMNISNCARGRNASAGGFSWRYIGEEEREFDVKKRGDRAVIKLTLDDKYVDEYRTMIDAAKSVGKKYNRCIKNACEGQSDSAYGYKWQYKQ